MKRSTQRILTTHVGSLPRPDDLMALYAANAPDETLQPLLNDYLAGMTEVVFAHDGTVAKIVGDALHVLFGAPGEQPDHATRAVRCSLALDAFAREFRQTWNERGVALGATRIGVHAGPAIVVVFVLICSHGIGGCVSGSIQRPRM